LAIESASRMPEVSPWLAEPQPIPLVKRREELGQGDIEAARQAVDHVQRRRLAAPLQIAQVGPVHPGAVGQFLLRNPEASPQFLDSGPERRP
jgi:hypothetical protein